MNILDQANFDINWLKTVYQDSKILVALLNAQSWRLEYANNSLLRVLGCENQDHQDFFDLFGKYNRKIINKHHRRHLLAIVLRDFCQCDLSQSRWCAEGAIATVKNPITNDSHYLQFWLRYDQIHLERIDPNLNEFADCDLTQRAIDEILEAETWLNRLNLDNYRVQGYWIWEAIDVTQQEQLQRLNTLLIEPDSLFTVSKFSSFQEQLRSLFRATNCFILSVNRDSVKCVTLAENHLQQSNLASLSALQNSTIMQIALTNQIGNIADLSQDCPTEFEQQLLQQNLKSLLLIPLVVTATHTTTETTQLMGLVGITSDQINNFDQLDINHAQTLIPALKNAFRQAIQIKFSHIHPSVEWRFQEEAERRSWGLPPEAISFDHVYPMYGLSDIRGSSDERNHAIQIDLIHQFNLALEIINLACHHRDIPFLSQLKQDLDSYSERLSQEIMVEDEITAIHYLQQHFETYFDFFAQINPEIATAIHQYQQACDNEQNCVYGQRDRYDTMIHDITSRLRHTWEQWQQRMQEIIPHYCDVEVTDGIDHMIYAGSSINHNFTHFHLHALRYEQLRAICDCGRTCFNLKNDYDTTVEVTHLVLVQDTYIDIFHDEKTEKLFDVKGTKDTRYEIVKKRIDKAVDANSRQRITQPGMLTIVYSTEDEWSEYRQYVRYLIREGWIDSKIESGTIEPLQGVTGLKFARVRILPETGI